MGTGGGERVTPDHVRGVAKEAVPASDPASGRIHLPKASAAELRRDFWEALSPKAKKLLRAKTVRPDQDRSAKLWELHNLCLDAGMTPGQTVRVVQACVYNKYKGQRRELRMLMSEAVRAEALQREKQQVPERRGGLGEVLPKPEDSKRFEGVQPLVTVPFAKFMAQDWPKPKWLVEGIWVQGAYGLWAGEFKSYKTTMLLDLAISVASGHPFLTKFEVVNPGSVLYLHEEGRRGEVQKHVQRVCSREGLAPSIVDDHVSFGDQGLDFSICSFPGLNLSEDDSRLRLELTVRRDRPKLLILEAFYLLSGEVNSKNEDEVAPILHWLKYLSITYSCAIILSHHYSKAAGTDGRAGLRITGSNVFNFWYESRILAERKGGGKRTSH